MSLVPIAASAFDVEIALAYATADNVAGRPVYARALAYLHEDAAAALARAVAKLNKRRKLGPLRSVY